MTQTILLLLALFVVFTMAISFYWNSKTIKFVVITLFVILANAVYFSLDGVKGWPSEDTSVVKGTLASVVIVNPSENSEGAIYISLFLTTTKKWYEYEYPRYAPKTFFVKYTNDRAAEFEKAKQAMEEGREVRINGIPPENTGSGDSEEIMGEELISSIIGQYLDHLIPKQGDTYKPKVPDVQIMEQQAPPEKGSN
jgi:hypothetical protein